MAASRSDEYQLSQSPAFQNRVQASLIAACVAIGTEGWTVLFHRERSTFAANILSANGTTQTSFVQLFANAAATDPNLIADATTGGTIVLTSTNRDAQGALVTDAHIDAAISGQFNSFIRLPSN